MSTASEAGMPEPDGLQFDRAEFEQPAPSSVACAACKRPIEDRYFEINGTIVCEPCREVIGSRLRGGAGFVGFLRALAFGAGAGAVGTAAYVAFLQATPIDFSLVSIFVGYLIGRAVRAGSRNRGGWPYQVLAVALTYVALGVTYTADLFLTVNPFADPNHPAPPLAAKAIFFVIYSLMMPVLRARASVITIAIMGFALWQAWKMNVRLKLAVTGPYQVGESGSDGLSAGAPAHA